MVLNASLLIYTKTFFALNPRIVIGLIAIFELAASVLGYIYLIKAKLYHIFCQQTV